MFFRHCGENIEDILTFVCKRTEHGDNDKGLNTNVDMLESPQFVN